MATSLINTTPQATYTSLLKLGDNSALSATLKRISDGAGNDTPIEISTAAVQFGGTTGMYWDNTNRRLGIGTNAPSYNLQVTGASTIRLSNIVFGTIGNNTITNTVSDTSINVSNGVGISGATVLTPSARLQVRGSGATSATTAFRVENSAGTAALTVNDAGAAVFTGAVDFQNIVGFRNSIDTPASSNLRFVVPGGAKTFLINKDYSNSPSASALLQVDTTTQGFLPPRMTTAQRDAIVSPATGLKVYNTDLGTTDTYDGTTWQRVGRSTLIKGAGTTSSTTALRVENSAGTALFTVNDVGSINMGIGAGSVFVCDAGGSDKIRANVVGVSIEGAAVTSAALTVNGTTKGFLPPRMTTTQKNAIATPAAGLVVYDTTTNKLCCYDGTIWNDLF